MAKNPMSIAAAQIVNRANKAANVRMTPIASPNIVRRTYAYPVVSTAFKTAMSRTSTVVVFVGSAWLDNAASRMISAHHKTAWITSARQPNATTEFRTGPRPTSTAAARIVSRGAHSIKAARSRPTAIRMARVSSPTWHFAGAAPLPIVAMASEMAWRPILIVAAPVTRAAYKATNVSRKAIVWEVSPVVATCASPYIVPTVSMM
jgi:hypothetical protein